MADETKKTVNLEDVLEQISRFPEEGKLKVISGLIRNARNGGINLQVRPEAALAVYEGRKKIEERYIEGYLRTYLGLFELAGQDEKVKECQLSYIGCLEARKAYGMAGDVAAEIGFEERAQQLYEAQIEQMDKERKNERKTNENYYNEMLLKAKKFDILKPRLERDLENQFRYGDLLRAARFCDTLGRNEEAERYRKLHELIA